MKTKKTYLAALPWFPGFYESMLDHFIDREIEIEMEGDPPDRPARTWEEVDAEANYSAARLAISEAWVFAFSQETGLEMSFDSLESPREYNFTTDRVFVQIPHKTLLQLCKLRRSPEFVKVVADWFTSRSGFVSFYPNDPAEGEWCKPVREWDCNQLSALIAAHVMASGETRGSLLDTLYTRSSVHEAAQAVWTPKPKTQTQKAA